MRYIPKGHFNAKGDNSILLRVLEVIIKYYGKIDFDLLKIKFERKTEKKLENILYEQELISFLRKRPNVFEIVDNKYVKLTDEKKFKKAGKLNCDQKYFLNGKGK